METFSALLAICAGHSPVPGEFPAQRPVTGSFNVFFDLRLNKRLSKQSWGWWFETLPCPLWCYCNDIHLIVIYYRFISFNLSHLFWLILPRGALTACGHILNVLPYSGQDPAFRERNQAISSTKKKLNRSSTGITAITGINHCICKRYVVMVPRQWYHQNSPRYQSYLCAIFHVNHGDIKGKWWKFGVSFIREITIPSVTWDGKATAPTLTRIPCNWYKYSRSDYPEISQITLKLGY